MIGSTLNFTLPCLIQVIVQKAAGTHSMTQSCVESVRSMVRHPISFVRSPTFLMMWGVYASTYCTGKIMMSIILNVEC